MVNVTFYGVRGSTPCSCPGTARYGGNTSCVALERPGQDPIVLDMGTGLRFLGKDRADRPFRGSILLSHLHWDHVIGLPFFTPMHALGASIDIYGPPEPTTSFGDLFGQMMRPPFFPISHDQLGGRVRFHDAWDDDFMVGDAKVRCRPVPHTGDTSGYRVQWNGASIAYVSDHQEPAGRPRDVAEPVLDLCDGVDLLIHDAQFTRDEYRHKAHWGHCTVEYAVEVARQAGARRLVLFHHDPDHDDDQLDLFGRQAGDLGAAAGLDEVLVAAERWTISLD